jgi:hypothetical protein
MIQHVWSVLCTRAVIDNETNIISLFDVVEQIAVVGPGGEGVAPVSLEMVTLWSRESLEEATRGRARLRIVGPDGMQIGNPIEHDVDLTNFVRIRNRFRMAAFPVIGPGKYSLVVEIEQNDAWRQVANVPVQLVIGS